MKSYVGQEARRKFAKMVQNRQNSAKSIGGTIGTIKTRLILRSFSGTYSIGTNSCGYGPCTQRSEVFHKKILAPKFPLSYCTIGLKIGKITKINFDAKFSFAHISLASGSRRAKVVSIDAARPKAYA